MQADFGVFVRDRRLALLEDDGSFTLRAVARRIGFQPSYLSKIERGQTPPPSEERIVALAQTLRVDADMLLARAGKVSKDVREIIMQNPAYFAQLIRKMRDLGHDTRAYILREALTQYGQSNATEERPA